MNLPDQAVPSKGLWRRLSLLSLALSFSFFLSACSGSNPNASTADPHSTTATSEEKNAAKNSTSKNSTSEVSTSSADTSQTEQSAPKTDRPYINQLLPEAQRIQQEFGIPVATTIAIAIHETGWGEFEIGQNNHFGLRCASDDCITLTKGGANISYETCPDESECFDMFARSLKDLSAGDPSDLRVIYKNGYATSPSWVRKVRRIRRQVRKTLDRAGIAT